MKLTGTEILNIYGILFNLATDDAKLQYNIYKLLNALDVEHKALEKAKIALVKKFNGKQLPDGRIFFDGEKSIINQVAYKEEEDKLLEEEIEIDYVVDSKYFTVENFIKHLDVVGKLVKLNKILVDNGENI